MHTQPEGPRRPPFDARAARRLREGLGMTPAHVSYGIWAAYGLQVPPATVAAWEQGHQAPTEAELSALAGALWCAPGDLIGVPDTLRAYRMARGLAAAEVASRIGMAASAYERAEATGQWRGNDRQAGALAAALGLPPPALIRLTGRDGELTELLRGAVTTRWQAYVRPVGKMVSLPRQRVQEVLRELHGEYQARMAATLNWGGGQASQESGEAGRAFLDGVLGEFWERAGEGWGAR